MKKTLRLVLLLVVVAIAFTTSSPKPALALIFCENAQGKACGGLPPQRCHWQDGSWGTCVCTGGFWECD